MDSLEQRVRDYASRMMERGRFVFIIQKGKPVGWVAFFLVKSTAQAKDFHIREMWSTPLDSPTGVICYVDKMAVNVPWSLELRKAVQESITSRHPQIQRAVWYRPTLNQDRKLVRPVRQRRTHAEV